MKCRHCQQEGCPNARHFEIEWAKDIIQSALKVLEQQADLIQDPEERIKIKSVYLGVALGEVRHRSTHPQLKHHTVEIIASKMVMDRYDTQKAQAISDMIKGHIVQQHMQDKIENQAIAEHLKDEKPN